MASDHYDVHDGADEAERERRATPQTPAMTPREAIDVLKTAAPWPDVQPALAVLSAVVEEREVLTEACRLASEVLRDGATIPQLEAVADFCRTAIANANKGRTP
jgi:hypothetical protein